MNFLPTDGPYQEQFLEKEVGFVVAQYWGVLEEIPKQKPQMRCPLFRLV